MKQHRRRFVAYLAGKVLGNDASQYVVDCEFSTKTGFSGNITAGGIFMLDLESRQRIVGQRSADTFSLAYDTDHIELIVREDDKTFSGFDTESRHEFRGVVSGTSVTLFDEEEKKDFTFTL